MMSACASTSRSGRTLDLLPPAHRLWRPAYGSSAAAKFERHILGVGRARTWRSSSSPPSADQFMRDGDARYPSKVFNHNQADVLAMVAIAIRACLAFDGGLPPGPGPGRAGEAEWIGLGRVYEEVGI